LGIYHYRQQFKLSRLYVWIYLRDMSILVFLIGHPDDLLVERGKVQLQHRLQTEQVQENAYKFNSKQKQQFFSKLVMVTERKEQAEELLQLLLLT